MDVEAVGPLAACGSDDDAGGSAPKQSASSGAAQDGGGGGGMSLDGKTIAFIQTGNIEYYEYGRQGAQMAIKQLGGKTKVYQSQFDAQKELANVQAAITQQADGVVLFPLSSASQKNGSTTSSARAWS